MVSKRLLLIQDKKVVDFLKTTVENVKGIRLEKIGPAVEIDCLVEDVKVDYWLFENVFGLQASIEAEEMFIPDGQGTFGESIDLINNAGANNAEGNYVNFIHLDDY